MKDAEKKSDISKEISEPIMMLKQEMLETEFLHMFKADRETILRTDASERAAGGALYQRDEKGELLLISFTSGKLQSHQMKYSTTEKELRAVFYALKQFRHFLNEIYRAIRS